jgi:hypothetical protein
MFAHFMFVPSTSGDVKKSKFRARVVEFPPSEVNAMKTNALTLLLAGAVGIAACARQTPPPTGPQGPTGPGTAQPPPNPNPEPPVPPVATPVAVAPSAPSAPAAAAPAGAAVPLAAAIPDQPVIATGEKPPAAAARPYREILELKKTGAADDVILNKVQTDNVNYHLTTAEVVELRDAGISETILEAMLRSGQAAPPSARK